MNAFVHGGLSSSSDWPWPRSCAPSGRWIRALAALLIGGLLTGCAQAPFWNAADDGTSVAGGDISSDFGADLMPRRGEILPASSLPADVQLTAASTIAPAARGTTVAAPAPAPAPVAAPKKRGKNKAESGPRSGEILPGGALSASAPPVILAAATPTASRTPAPAADVRVAAVAEAPMALPAEVSAVPLAPPAPVAGMPAELAPAAAPAAGAGTASTQVALAASAIPADRGDEPLLKLGPGDAVIVTVFGRPEFNTTTYVSEKGEIAVPLAGNVPVAGLSPSDAGRRVGDALKRGQFLVNPQVSIALANFRSQQVSVLGEVKAPGRFPIETKTSVFDLLAQAGGVLETGSDVVYLLRPDDQGQVQRYPLDLKGLTTGNDASIRQVSLRGGDSIYVPRAEHYYVYGEVTQPNRYRLEPGTTVVQAISRSGGLTPRGSERRIEIKRRDADGKYRTIDAELTDTVKADDVIRVKERIF